MGTVENPGQIDNQSLGRKSLGFEGFLTFFQISVEIMLNGVRTLNNIETTSMTLTDYLAFWCFNEKLWMN